MSLVSKHRGWRGGNVTPTSITAEVTSPSKQEPHQAAEDDVAARRALTALAIVLAFILMGLALDSLSSPVNGGGTETLDMTFVDGATRSVRYIPQDVAIWEQGDALSWGLAALVVVLVFVANLFVASRRRSTLQPVRAGKGTVIRGLRRRPGRPKLTDRAA